MKSPYPTYKPTPLPWLPKVPEHWERKPITAITQPRSVKGRDDLPLLSVYRDYGVILKDSRDDNHNRAGEDLTTYKIVKPGNLVLNKMKTWQGSLGVSSYEGLVSPAYIVCNVSSEIHGEFLHYLLRCHKYIYEYNRLSYGVRNDQWDMRYEDFKRIPVFLPPLPEQRLIAAFLDHKCGLIDTCIQKKTRLIELLKEQKQAIINKAVTRGLDDRVRLKPSGIEWLGEVPEHWIVTKLGYFVDILPGYAFASDEYSKNENDIRLLRGINVAPGEIKWEEVFYWPKEDENKYARYLLNQGDIVFGMDRPWISSGMRVAKIGQKDVPSLLLQRVARLRAKRSLKQDFLEVILKSKLFVDYFSPILTGISVPHISDRQIASFIFGVPSMIEQEKIVKYIESESATIDRTITRIEREIELMQEYKTTLIAEAVTGRIDVRGWQPRSSQQTLAAHATH